MIRIVLILLLLVNKPARGQMLVGLDKDSLRRVLMTHPPDTDKVTTLVLLGHQFGNAQPDSAILYFQEAARLSRALGFHYDPLDSVEIDHAAIRRRTWVIVSVAGILLLAALITGTLAYDRQRRRLGRQTTETQQVRDENRRLKALLDAQDHEERRISQEMQRDIGSGLASLSLLSRTPGWDGDPATNLEMQQTVAQLIWRTTEIAWMLDHQEDSLESLVAIIRRNATWLLEPANIHLRLDIDDDIPKITVTREFRRDVYLIVKEALHNTIRHSEASIVEISIHIKTGEMTIVVGDNGKGLYRAGGSHWGNGMKDMQRRVEQIDGRMEITAGAGTAITIVSPLPYL